MCIWSQDGICQSNSTIISTPAYTYNVLDNLISD